jgi:hypothetical protein
MKGYRCGNEPIAAGALFSPVSRPSFRPQDSKFLALESGDVVTKAMMSRDCGVIEIVGDINKLRRLASGPPPSPDSE